MGVDWCIPYFGWCRKTPKYLVTGSVYCWVYLIPLYKSNMWLVLWVNFLPLLVCKDSLVRILRYVKRHWHGEYAFKKCPWNVYIYKLLGYVHFAWSCHIWVRGQVASSRTWVVFQADLGRPEMKSSHSPHGFDVFQQIFGKTPVLSLHIVPFSI